MAGDASVAELILKIVADSTEVRKALREAADATENFNKDTTESSKKADSALGSSMNRLENNAKKTTGTFGQMGTGLRQMSRNLAQFSALIMGPVVGALAVASKTNYSVATGMRNLGIATQYFSNELATAALPMVKKFTGWIFDLTEKFKALPEAQKKAIVDGAIWVGGITAGLAVVLKFAFLLAKLPALFTAAGVAAKAFGAILAAGWIVKLGLAIAAFKGVDWLLKQSPVYKKSMEKIPPTMAGGKGVGENEVTLDKIAIKARELTQALAKLKNAWTLTVEGFNVGLEETLKKFGSWGSMMQNLAMNLATGMSSVFSDFFFDVFSGEMKTFEEYAASFGKTIIKMIADLIAQLMVMWVVVQLIQSTPTGRAMINMLGWGGMMSAENQAASPATKHEGGYIRKAHDGLSMGEIPIIAQKGEGILSRNGMASLGGEDKLNQVNGGNGVGGGATINLVQVIQAWGPEDVYRNRKMLASGMIEELERNGGFRTAIKKYG